MEDDTPAAAAASSVAAAAASPAAAAAASSGDSKKRKKSADSDNDNDGEEGDAPAEEAEAAEAEEESDPEEDKQIRKKKKSKKPGAQFIDDIAVNDDDEDEEDEEEDEFDQHESDNGDGEADDGEDLTDERQIRRDAAEGDSDHDMESPAERKARKKAEKARGKGSRVDLRGEDDTLHMSLDQIREQQEAQALKNKFEQKYAEAGAGYDYDDYDEAGANVRSSGAALPSIRDPSLFVIQCGKGVSAEDVCWKLMQQYYKRERDAVESLRYQIFSCFTTPAARDRVYIEADRETHVESAIKALPYRGLLRYYRASTTNYKVPLSEMVASLKFRSEETSVELKQWVRMKRGPYKDDLAQVVRTADQGTIITVKLVPRIDFAYLDAKRDNDRLTRAQFKASGGVLAGKRPAQKLFDHAEIERNYTAPERKRGAGLSRNTSGSSVMYWDFMGAKFKNGFFYKDVKMDALQTAHVNPLQDELDRFASKTYQSDDDDEEDEGEDAEGGDAKKKIKREADSEAADAAAAAAAGFGGHAGASRKPVVFSLNDRVQVTAGGMKDVTGRILSLKNELLTIRPDDARLGSSFDEVATHVRKCFKIGDHIKIVSGILKGETGMITWVLQDEDELAVHLDSGLRAGGDPRVSAQDAIESQEISTGRESFGSFEQGDLVQLAGDQVGMIVRINMSDMTVLSTLGSLLQPKLQEVRFKLNDKFARAFDKGHAGIELGDVVQCWSGPHRGKKATVKHIVKKTLFLYNREVPDNGGLFIMQSGQVILMQGDAGGAMSGQIGVAPRSPSHGSRSPGPAPRSPGGSHTAASTTAMRPGSFLRRDPIIGLEVRITGGQYKSLVGMCKDVNSHGQARVELRALFRTITIPRNQITEIERSNARAVEWGGAAGRNPMLGGATPLVGGATPRHAGFGGATPAHEGFGSQTPYGGSRTPSHRTPSHLDGGADVWAAQTPAHRQEDRVAEEEEEQEEWRTGAAGEAAPTPVNPQTPGAVPRTPGANPNTPYNPTTPHDADMADAPSTPYDPEAQAAAASAAEPEEEEEPVAAAAAAEPVEDVVPGLFTRDWAIGCYVLVSGSEAQQTILGVEDGGRQVRVRASSSGSGAGRLVPQADVRAVHPAASDTNVLVCFLSDMNSQASSHRMGDRLMVLSTFGSNVLIADSVDSGEPDMITAEQLTSMCKCAPVETEAAGKKAKGKTSKKGGRKK